MNWREYGKRLLSMLLALVMIVGVLPAAVFAADETVLDAAIFCSDVHGSASDLTSVMSGIKTSGVTYSSIGFVGDTCLTVAKTQSAVNSGLGYTPTVMFSYAKSHDTENSADISDNWNYSGEVEGVSKYYLVYTIRETDMQNASDAATAAPAFTSWYNGLSAAEKQLPIFIMSHRPLHDRRDDNAGAATWYSAISAAAESSDIVFFWAHNHTGDNSVDQAAYYIAKDGTEKLSVYNGASVVPNFTYMNAGYINANGQNPARLGIATTVQITASSLIFQDYNSSGAYTGTYAHNVTVNREFAPEVEEETVTPKTLSITGYTEYTVGAPLQDPTEIVVIYSDKSTKTLSATDLKLTITTEDGADLVDNVFVQAGTYNLLYSYTDSESGQTASATLVVTVVEAETTAPSTTTPPTTTAPAENTVYTHDGTLYIGATGAGLTGITATYSYADHEALMLSTFDNGVGVAYDITLEGHTTGNEVTYQIALDDSVPAQNLGVYCLNDAGEVVAVAHELVVEDGVTMIQFKTTYVGTILYGTIAVPDGYVFSELVVTNTGASNYFIGDSFDVYLVNVIAVYKNTAGETFKRVLAEYEEGYVDDGYTYNWPDMTTAGTKTIAFTYGGQTVSIQITVWQETFADESSNVSVAVGNFGVTELTVSESKNGFVAGALENLLEDGYVAYDIELEGFENGDTAVVTLPIPEGVTNPVVYYVSDDGQIITNMMATDNGDGTVSFETTHFSTYALGDGTSITLNDSSATVNSTLDTVYNDETVTIYKLVATPEIGKQYLIVNSSNGSGYGLEGDTSGFSVSTFTGGSEYYSSWDSEAETGTLWSAGSDVYATTSTEYLWTVGGSEGAYTFTNGSVTLGASESSCTASIDFESPEYSTFSYSGNKLMFTEQSSYGLYCSSGTWSASNRNQTSIYFYEPVDVIKVTTETTGTEGGTYSVTADNITDVPAINGKTVNLASTLNWTPANGSDANPYPNNWTVTYTVVKDKGTPGVITSIDGSVAKLSGTVGAAVVRATWTNGTYTAYNEFVVDAVTPEYALAVTPENGSVKVGNDLTFTASTTVNGETYTYGTVEWKSSNENVATVENGVVTALSAGNVTITATWADPNGNVHKQEMPVTITDADYDITIDQGDTYTHKGVKKGDTLQLTATLTADGEEVEKTLTWYCYLPDGTSAATIASIDQNGKLTFTGEEGVIKVMVAYTVNDSLTVNDIITITVRKSTAITPNESTSEFPRWPNEGAVRFDKTATAVGNFSETGIAQIELSMAGIPLKTGGDIDVVLVLDASGSMTATRISALKEAAYEFIKLICLDSNGNVNNNRVAVVFFGNGVRYTTTGYNAIESNLDTDYVSVTTGTTSSYGYTLGTVDSVDSDSTIYDVIYNGYPTSGSGNNITGGMSGGTYYSYGLAVAEAILQTAESDGIGDTRQQYCLFLSDGAPTSYRHASDYETATDSDGDGKKDYTVATGSGNKSGDASTTTAGHYEYYSAIMRDAGVTLYGVGCALDTASYPNSYTFFTKITASEDRVYFVTEAQITDGALKDSFTTIAEEIKSAATNVEVEDVITPQYDLIFELPNSSIEGLPEGQEFYLEVVDYPLDSTTHERTGTSTIKQRIYLATDATTGKVYISKIIESDGTPTAYTVDSLPTPAFKTKAEGEKAYYTVAEDGTYTYNPEGDGTHHMTSGAYVVLNSDGSLQSLHTVNFTYVVSSKQLNWTVTSMSETSETALRYFVYLKNSGGVAADRQIDPGTYPTNVYATLTYTNINNKECEQVFPIPQMTWNGAQVSYVFYLVNEQGQPVNRAGRVVTFAEAIFVTDVHTLAIVWNDLEQAAGLEAAYLANKLLPSDYSLYDTNASYNIHVYEDEKGVNLNNHFVLAGTSSDKTTYVYNNKTDVDKYNTHGTYAATATYLCKSYSVTATVDADGNITAASYTSVTGETQIAYDDLTSKTGATNIGGYAYYVDENGDVYTIVQKKDATAITGFDFANTTVAFAVVWEKKLVADTVVVDFGLPVDINVVSNDFVYNYITGIGATDPKYGINIGYKTDTGALTANELTVNGHSVVIKDQNHIRFTPGSMEFNAPVTFYYETKVEAYENDKVVDSYMYSSVTVIPATTVYYEDSFVDLSVQTQTNGVWADDATKGWSTAGTTISATQAQDRPGTAQISGDIDADNNYGYDDAYANMSQYSLGSAAVINVKTGTRGVATFNFYGTGFDIISLTSNTTGAITVKVVDESGNEVRTLMVDTYYGYTYENGEWVVSADDTENSLYQIPVMKVFDLPYGKYTVTITAAYSPIFDHDQACTCETEGCGGCYNFYLDAIRIYDPCGDSNSTANGAYEADGEGWPVYEELRDIVIESAAMEGDTNEIPGLVFIDGINETASVADYAGYGPNNELYLASGQAVVFNLDQAYASILKDVQIAMKAVDGEASYEISNATASGETVTQSNVMTGTIQTATDMYYSIKELSAGTIVIKNTGSNVLSITNIKFTFTEDPGVDSTLLYVDRDVIVTILANMQSNKDFVTPDNEQEVFQPDEVILAVDAPESVVAGESFQVNVTTIGAVNSVTINDAHVWYTDIEGGNRVWTAVIKTDSAGSKDISISANAVNADNTVTTATASTSVLVAPTVFTVSAPAYVTVGHAINATITTSDDITKLVIGETEITDYVTAENGNRIWSYSVTPSAAGEVEIAVNGYADKTLVATSAVSVDVYDQFATEFAVSAPAVYAGSSITVTVTTSEDVDAVMINGELITTYRVRNGSRIWTTKIATTSADANTSKTVTVVAYNMDVDADGNEIAIASAPSVTNVSVNAIKSFSDVIKSILGWLFG